MSFEGEKKTFSFYPQYTASYVTEVKQTDQREYFSFIVLWTSKLFSVQS